MWFQSGWIQADFSGGSWVQSDFAQVDWISGGMPPEHQPVVPPIATLSGVGSDGPVFPSRRTLEQNNTILMLVALAFMETRQWEV